MSQGRFFLPGVLLLLHSCLGLQNGDMRLVGGRLPSEGRVEVFLNGEWGTVCDDDWDFAEAVVVCRHLKYPGATTAVSGGVYGEGNGRILMDNLHCDGTEKDLSSCNFPGWGVTDCKHAEDAGVVCQQASKQNVKREYFVNHGTTLLETMGELFHSGRFCDLNITVVVDNGAVETICAHKFIVSLEQKDAFLNGSQENLNIFIEVSSNCRKHVTSFVRYLYTHQINISVSSAECIHKMASDWGLKPLQEEAGKLFTWLLPVDATFQTQISLYDYAISSGDTTLQKACLRFLAWNCEALVASARWGTLPLGTVKALLPRSDLVVPSEFYVLQAIEKWEAAQGNASATEDRFGLLMHVRFPMISAQDLHRLRGPRYQAGKLQGFQFNALSIGNLFGELLSQWRSYTPRIYTGSPWSFNFSSQAVANYINNYNSPSSLSFSFRTPVHNSAYFALFRDRSWTTRLYVKSHECLNNGVKCPAAMLTEETSNSDLPTEFQKGIVYQNKVLLMCDGEYVFHIQDIILTNNQNIAVMPANSNSGQTYPCHSDRYAYRIVVRPKYSTGVKFTEDEDDMYEESV